MAKVYKLNCPDCKKELTAAKTWDSEVRTWTRQDGYKDKPVRYGTFPSHKNGNDECPYSGHVSNEVVEKEEVDNQWYGI